MHIMKCITRVEEIESDHVKPGMALDSRCLKNVQEGCLAARLPGYLAARLPCCLLKTDVAARTQKREPTHHARVSMQQYVI